MIRRHKDRPFLIWAWYHGPPGRDGGTIRKFRRVGNDAVSVGRAWLMGRDRSVFYLVEVRDEQRNRIATILA